MAILDRRTLLGAAAGLAVSLPARARSAPLDLTKIHRELERRHDEAVERLRDWLKAPCIAAEDFGYDTGVPVFEKMLKDAGFQKVERVPTRGNTTSPDAPFIWAQIATYERGGVHPVLWTRSAGSWPGYVFTGPPLSLPAGDFGMGPWRRRTRAGRVLPRRLQGPLEDSRLRRRGAIVRRVPLHARLTLESRTTATRGFAGYG
jgi:hypothetical protein